MSMQYVATCVLQLVGDGTSTTFTIPPARLNALGDGSQTNINPLFTPVAAAIRNTPVPVTSAIIDGNGNLVITFTTAWDAGQAANVAVDLYYDSGTTLPSSPTISGTVAATQSGAWTVSVSNFPATQNVNVTNASIAVTGTFWPATQPVSGTVTANAGTGTFTVAGTVAATQSGAWNIGTLTSITNAVTVAQATAANLNATVTGTVAATQSGTWTVQQGTPPWSVGGNEAAGSTDSGNPVKIGGVFTTAQPTLTTGQRGNIQLTARGAVLVATGVDAFAVNASQSGTWTVAQGTPAATANAWPHKITDGTNTTAVKAANTGPSAADPALVVTLSPNLAARTFITLFVDAAAGSTSEAMLSFDINKGGTITTGATSYTVTAGKTFRIQSMGLATWETTNQVSNARARLRADAASVSTTSGVLCGLQSGTTGTRDTVGNAAQTFADGLDIPAGTKIGISQNCNTTNTSVTVSIVGYEY